MDTSMDFDLPEDFFEEIFSDEDFQLFQPANPSESELEENHQNQTNSLVCVVCGAPARGYNFDQITCEPCKAFFRRNALKDNSHLKCNFQGQCVINMETRRSCAYCRLKKCFQAKMRSDWIRTDEEKFFRKLQNYLKQQEKLRKELMKKSFNEENKICRK